MWKDLLINFREYLFMNVTLDLVTLYKILKQHKKILQRSNYSCFTVRNTLLKNEYQDINLCNTSFFLSILPQLDILFYSSELCMCQQ